MQYVLKFAAPMSKCFRRPCQVNTFNGEDSDRNSSRKVKASAELTVLCLKRGHIQKEKYILKQLCAKTPKTLPFVMLKIEFVFPSYKSSVNSV